jgi:hypothetical protein
MKIILCFLLWTAIGSLICVLFWASAGYIDVSFSPYCLCVIKTIDIYIISAVGLLSGFIGVLFYNTKRGK